MIKTILKDYFGFIKKPIDNDIFTKLIYVLFFICINLIISYILIIPLLEYVDETESLITTDYKDASTAKVFVILVLITPLIEEFVFRYFLRYKSFMSNFISLEKWNKIFPLLVYLFNISFALIHLTNFSNSSVLFYLLSPIIVLSQAVTGFSITYIRVRLNFIYGVIFHWIWNLVVFFGIPLIENYF